MAAAGVVQRIAGPALSAGQLQEILRLRADVFVVEQACAYADVDGRDLLPATLHLWLAAQGPRGDGEPGGLDAYRGILAYLRVLAEPGGGTRIGRVVTAPAARGRGLARVLLRDALEGAARPVVLNAQAHLAGFYAAEGFSPDGPEYLDDGIPHVPMRLP